MILIEEDNCLWCGQKFKFFSHYSYGDAFAKRDSKVRHLLWKDTIRSHKRVCEADFLIKAEGKK